MKLKKRKAGSKNRIYSEFIQNIRNDTRFKVYTLDGREFSIKHCGVVKFSDDIKGLEHINLSLDIIKNNDRPKDDLLILNNEERTFTLKMIQWGYFVASAEAFIRLIGKTLNEAINNSPYSNNYLSEFGLYSIDITGDIIDG